MPIVLKYKLTDLGAVSRYKLLGIRHLVRCDLTVVGIELYSSLVNIRHKGKLGALRDIIRRLILATLLR